MEPDVRYCTTTDGVRIAYTVTGEGPVLVAIIDPIVSHVVLEWSHPLAKRILEAQAARFTLVRLDLRGTGLSEREMPTSPDDVIVDIEAVVDRLRLDRFTLQANTSVTPIAIVFAARHRDQVSRLVLVDGYARSTDLLTSPQVVAFSAAAASDWETATEAIGAIAFGPGREESRLHGEFIRACVGPEYLNATANFAPFDASEIASTLPMPVLMVRHLGYRLITDEMTHGLVSRIPDARLATVKGMWPDDIEGLARRIAAFVNEDAEVGGERHAPILATGQDSGTAVILFTDIVSSTALTERMGDAAFREASRRLDEELRGAMRDHGGTPVEGKLLGDGVMGTFGSAREAIAAALDCSTLSAASELGLHIGLHAGDVIREDNNVYGGAVNIASRICALSAPGEILVSDVVRGMGRSSAGVMFEDRGEQEMKGLAESVRMYEVRARSAQ